MTNGALRPPDDGPVLDPDEAQRLLALARHALEARVRGGPPPEPESGGALDLPCAVFVSLHCGGELRGCLGTLDHDMPLGLGVVRLAGLAADSDPRFTPVAPEELPEVTLEISVLTPPCPALSPDVIEVGRHGLVIEQGRQRGLLLPQVAVEHGWNRDTFLDHACLKAGLRRDAWRRGARILVFEAHVLGERTSGG